MFQKTGEQKQALCWNEHFSKPSMNPKVNEANISNGRRNQNKNNGEKLFLALPVFIAALAALMLELVSYIMIHHSVQSMRQCAPIWSDNLQVHHTSSLVVT